MLDVRTVWVLRVRTQDSAGLFRARKLGDSEENPRNRPYFGPNRTLIVTTTLISRVYRV